MGQPTIIYLIRHGKVDNWRKLYYGRLPGFYLSNTGRREAESAGEALSGHTLAAIYSSPMLRARETAEIVAHFHDRLHVSIDERINEVHSPYDGWRYKDVKALNFNVFHPKYELPPKILKRAKKFIYQMRHDYPGQEVAAATHGAIIQFMFLFSQRKRIAELEVGQLEKMGLPDSYFAAGSISKFTYHTMDKEEVPDYLYLNPNRGEGWEGVVETTDT